MNRVDLERAKQKTPVCGECKEPLSVRGAVVDVGGSALGQIFRKSTMPVIASFGAASLKGYAEFEATFAEVAAELAGRGVFVKIDTVRHPAAQSLYDLKTVPALLVFFGGRETWRKPGVMPAAEFRKWVRELIP